MEVSNSAAASGNKSPKDSSGFGFCGPYLQSLTNRGYKIYSSASEAIEDNKEMIDYGFSIQVIEHVKNPLEFLKEIRKLIKPGGRLLISTPNRNDILMTLLKDQFYQRRFIEKILKLLNFMIFIFLNLKKNI